LSDRQTKMLHYIHDSQHKPMTDIVVYVTAINNALHNIYMHGACFDAPTAETARPVPNDSL